jgi:hypothetical protein
MPCVMAMQRECTLQLIRAGLLSASSHSSICYVLISFWSAPVCGAHWTLQPTSVRLLYDCDVASMESIINVAHCADCRRTITQQQRVRLPESVSFMAAPKHGVVADSAPPPVCADAGRGQRHDTTPPPARRLTVATGLGLLLAASDVHYCTIQLVDGALKGLQCRDLLKAAACYFKLGDYHEGAHAGAHAQQSGIVATYRGVQLWQLAAPEGAHPLVRARPGEGWRRPARPRPWA